MDCNFTPFHFKSYTTVIRKIGKSKITKQWNEKSRNYCDKSFQHFNMWTAPGYCDRLGSEMIMSQVTPGISSKITERAFKRYGWQDCYV